MFIYFFVSSWIIISFGLCNSFKLESTNELIFWSCWSCSVPTYDSNISYNSWILLAMHSVDGIVIVLYSRHFHVYFIIFNRVACYIYVIFKTADRPHTETIRIMILILVTIRRRIWYYSHIIKQHIDTYYTSDPKLRKIQKNTQI